jgi:hypothetical protein
VDIYEPDPNSQTDDWQMSVTGTPEAVEQAFALVQNTLQERLAIEAQQEEQLASQELFVPPTMPGNFAQPQTMPGEALQYEIPATAATTVLPIPAEYIGYLGDSDIKQLEEDLGVQIDIAEGETVGGQSGEWIFTVYGNPENRDACHRAIEDLLTRRQEEAQGVVPPTMVDAGMQQTTLLEPGQVPLGPDDITVVSMPFDYLRLLYDLDAISDVTGAQVTVQEPAPGDVNVDWTLTIIGTEKQRQQAHKAIQDTIESELSRQQQNPSGSAP